MKKLSFKINGEIRSKEVRLVRDSNTSEVLSTTEALKEAERLELDLIEISPNANPPVCKIMDYSKFLYQMKKKEKEIKSKQVNLAVKEIRLTPQTDEHDYGFKLKHAKEFLEKGNKLKLGVFFKGRAIIYKEQGRELLDRFIEDLSDVGVAEKKPEMEGRRMILFINPKKKN